MRESARTARRLAAEARHALGAETVVLVHLTAGMHTRQDKSERFASGDNEEHAAHVPPSPRGCRERETRGVGIES